MKTYVTLSAMRFVVTSPLLLVSTTLVAGCSAGGETPVDATVQLPADADVDLVIVHDQVSDGGSSQNTGETNGNDTSADTTDRGTIAADGGVTRDAAIALDASADSSAELDAAEPTPCPADAATPELTVDQLQVTQTDGSSPPRKGAELRWTLNVFLADDCTTTVDISGSFSSQRFNDFTEVPFGSSQVTLMPGDNRVELTDGPFLEDPTDGKQFAIGSGPYTIEGIQIGNQQVSLEAINRDFTVESSSALLVPVVYDERYFNDLEGNPHSTLEDYLTSVFTRPSEVFTPEGDDPDGPGTFESFETGFDGMMGVQHMFRTFPDFPGENTTTDGWCEDATAYATQVLGLAEPWGSHNDTRSERHGFDYLIALTPDMGGGVACGWLDVQVSSFINRDVDRQQVIAVHETGHLFGAPHCDDVGNGEGGSLQGYVMCSGEKHERYPDNFVWHRTSRDRMQSHWD